MFDKDSRYRFSAVSSTASARHAGARGVQVRVALPTGGHFQHRVGQHDRLDLLAYRYYKKSAAWWRICDANPQAEWPADLIDPAPLVREHLVVESPGMAARRAHLVTSLATLGIVVDRGAILLVAGEAVWLDEAQTTSGGADALAAWSVQLGALFDAGSFSRPALIAAIESAELTLSETRTVTTGPVRFDLMWCDDRSALQEWNEAIAAVGRLRGVAAVQGDAGTSTIAVTYNAGRVARETLCATCAAHGLSVQPSSWRESPVGSHIVIPPDLPVRPPA